jgi:hypothetical protein
MRSFVKIPSVIFNVLNLNWLFLDYIISVSFLLQPSEINNIFNFANITFSLILLFENRDSPNIRAYMAIKNTNC